MVRFGSSSERYGTCLPSLHAAEVCRLLYRYDWINRELSYDANNSTSVSRASVRWKRHATNREIRTAPLRGKARFVLKGSAGDIHDAIGIRPDKCATASMS